MSASSIKWTNTYSSIISSCHGFDQVLRFQQTDIRYQIYLLSLINAEMSEFMTKLPLYLP